MATFTTKFKVGDLVIASFAFGRIPAAITSIYFKGKLCKVNLMHPEYSNEVTMAISSLEPIW